MGKWDRHRVLVLALVVMAFAMIMIVVWYGPAQ